MSSLSALLSAYGESDGEPEDATPPSTAANGRPEGKAEAPELSALDLLFQRVDLELAFEGVLQPAVYDSEGDVAAKVRENWQRSREVGMGVVEYVRTKGNFNNPELIRLLRSQLPFTLQEYGTPTPATEVPGRWKGTELLKEQDRVRKEREEKLKKEREKPELKSPPDPPPLARAASTASRWAAAVAADAADGPGPLPAVPDPLAPNPSHSPHSSASARGAGPTPSAGRPTPTRSPKGTSPPPDGPQPTEPAPTAPPAPPSTNKSPASPPNSENPVPPPLVPLPSSPPPLSPATSSTTAPSGGALLQSLLSEKQQQALTDPAVFATLAPAEQQQILGAIRAVSQKLVAGEARGGSAGLAPKLPASPQDTGKPPISTSAPCAGPGSSVVTARRASESEEAPPKKRTFPAT